MTYVPIRLIQLSSVQKKKQGHIPPISVPHPSATCKYRVEMSFKPPTWLSFMHTTSSPSFSSGTMEQIACFWRSVGAERVKLYAASTKGKLGQKNNKEGFPSHFSLVNFGQRPAIWTCRTGYGAKEYASAWDWNSPSARKVTRVSASPLARGNFWAL